MGNCATTISQIGLSFLSLTLLILNFNLRLTVDLYGKSNCCLLMSDGIIHSYTFPFSQSDTKTRELAIWAFQIIFFFFFVSLHNKFGQFGLFRWNFCKCESKLNYSVIYIAKPWPTTDWFRSCPLTFGSSERVSWSESLDSPTLEQGNLSLFLELILWVLSYFPLST